MDDRGGFLGKSNSFMKASRAKLTESLQSPVFPKSLHQPRPTPATDHANPKSHKRDNIFSKSRDRREDRGRRQVKNTHSAQTMPHGR
jgi:hypothetical protein